MACNGPTIATLTPSILNGNIVWFGSATNYPAGTYCVGYVNGALQLFGNNGLWYLNFAGIANWGILGYRVVFNDGANELIYQGSDDSENSQAEIELKNTDTSLGFYHTGGKIGLYLHDVDYSNNLHGSPDPTFGLHQGAIGPPPPPPETGVRITYWKDAAFTVPLPCCESSAIPAASLWVSTDAFTQLNPANADPLNTRSDEQGRAWALDSGWYEVRGDLLLSYSPFTGFNEQHFAHVVGISAVDVDVSVDIRTAEGGAGTNGFVNSVDIRTAEGGAGTNGFVNGVLGRYSGYASYYAATLDSQSRVSMVRVQPGGTTTLASRVMATIAGVVQTLLLRLRGANWEVWLNGQLIISGTDTAISGPGFVGLYAKHPPLTAAIMDNWRAEGFA